MITQAMIDGCFDLLSGLLAAIGICVVAGSVVLGVIACILIHRYCDDDEEDDENDAP